MIIHYLFINLWTLCEMEASFVMTADQSNVQKAVDALEMPQFLRVRRLFTQAQRYRGSFAAQSGCQCCLYVRGCLVKDKKTAHK